MGYTGASKHNASQGFKGGSFVASWRILSRARFNMWLGNYQNSGWETSFVPRVLFTLP
jgi:hypothetical protein